MFILKLIVVHCFLVFDNVKLCVNLSLLWLTVWRAQAMTADTIAGGLWWYMVAWQEPHTPELCSRGVKGGRGVLGPIVSFRSQLQGIGRPP